MRQPLRIALRNAPLGVILLGAFAANAQVVANPNEKYYSQPVEAVASVPPGGFSAEVNGTQTFSYDSNPLRVTTGAKSIYGSTTSPELVLRNRTATSLVESTTRVDANVYDRAAFNSVDVHENLKLDRHNERWTAAVTTSFDRDTTRESEYTNFNNTQPRVYSNRITAAPEIDFRQNPRDTWSLRGSATHDSYSDNAYTDYNFYTIAPTYEHAFDEQNTGRISLNAQRYETTSGADSSSNSYGPSIGWTNKATKRLTLHADAGALLTDKQGANSNLDDNTWDYVFAAGVGYNGVQNDFDITARRAQEPFGNGTEALVDSVVAQGNHHINETVALKGNAAWRKAEYPSGQPGINLSREYSLGTGIRYQFLKETALNADYTYHNEDLTNLPGSVNEHVVMLGISYAPSWGRK